jgi:hypothetical protein
MDRETPGYLVREESKEYAESKRGKESGKV